MSPANNVLVTKDIFIGLWSRMWLIALDLIFLVSKSEGEDFFKITIIANLLLIFSKPESSLLSVLHTFCVSQSVVSNSL